MNKILGINERRYLNSRNISETIAITVVLVAGGIDNYTAYAGAGTKEDAEWISRHGNKLSFQEACCHFPGQLKEENYR